MPVDPSEADTDEWPADPCVIPPEAMHEEAVPVIEGKRLSERCPHCSHLWKDHWDAVGCGILGCYCEKEGPV